MQRPPTFRSPLSPLYSFFSHLLLLPSFELKLSSSIFFFFLASNSSFQLLLPLNSNLHLLLPSSLNEQASKSKKLFIFQTSSVVPPHFKEAASLLFSSHPLGFFEPAPRSSQDTKGLCFLLHPPYPRNARCCCEL